MRSVIINLPEFKVMLFFVVVPLVIAFRKGQEFFPAGKHVDRPTQPRVQLVLTVISIEKPKRCTFIFS
jgi:hypothetical protein